MNGIRVGHGYDLHRLEAGSGVVLGGVKIQCNYRLIAHSDGDVLIHALCDALLGAAAMGDIGKLFPDTDPRFENADSRQLLREVVDRIRSATFEICNVDLTLVAQTPRVSPYTDQMCIGLAEVMQVDRSQVNIKATTNEGLDAVGRKEAIAAHAVALIQGRI